MPIYNLAGGSLPGWTNLQSKYGMLGNTSGLYNLTSEMYKGSSFYQSWHWTHGNASEKILFGMKNLCKVQVFFIRHRTPHHPDRV